MTIAQAFNEITIAQGGTPNAGGTIAGAIDALNDTLAGSDQKPAQTIEGAIRLLGAHIGGGVAPSGTIEITENGEGIDVAQYAYADVNVSGGGSVSLGGMQLFDTKKILTPVFLDKDGDQFVCTITSSISDNIPGVVAAGTFIGATEGYIPTVYTIADHTYVKDLEEVGEATVTIMGGQAVTCTVYAVEDVTAANYIEIAED